MQKFVWLFCVVVLVACGAMLLHLLEPTRLLRQKPNPTITTYPRLAGKVPVCAVQHLPR